MVETALFPRPNFASFLRSDDSADPLSYYEYQRLQRMQKVARLQERRSKSYEPGYKKPLGQLQLPVARGQETASYSTTSSRQIFVKPSLRRDRVASEHTKMPQLKPAASPTAAMAYSSDKVVPMPFITKREPQCLGREAEKEPGRSGREGELKQAVARRLSRPVKSATVQGVSFSKPPLLQRPKTATTVETRDIGTLTMAVVTSEKGGTRGDRSLAEDGTKVLDLDDAGNDNNVTGGTAEPEFVVRLKENMAQAYHWTTSTQRGYNEVDWENRIPPALPPPTTTTIEQFPDPVSQKLTFRRYNSCPEPWQVYGSEWDYVQARFGDLQYQEPHNLYIPGYSGCVPGSGREVDHPLLSKLLVRRLTPRPSSISRRANIPGYTGHTHWSRIDPAHSELRHPNPLTSTRTHRELPLEEDHSPFRRTSPMSKMVTLVSPYNPFNKIEY